jgi:hypothetical protein
VTTPAEEFAARSEASDRAAGAHSEALHAAEHARAEYEAARASGAATELELDALREDWMVAAQALVVRHAGMFAAVDRLAAAKAVIAEGDPGAAERTRWLAAVGTAQRRRELTAAISAGIDAFQQHRAAHERHDAARIRAIEETVATFVDGGQRR